LYHVAYGSSPFADSSFDLSQRKDVTAVIGEKPENIVYHYFACHKSMFFAQFGKLKQPQFFDRITNQTSDIPLELLTQLCELLAAKEIDYAIYDPQYAAKHAKRLMDIFSPIQAFLSLNARRKIDYVFAAKT
jgi:hypothetical protein